MGKKRNERRLADNEARAVHRMMRVSPRKLNLVAAMIRGKKAERALSDLRFSNKRIAENVRKCLLSAVANAENNHDLDVDNLIVSEAHVGKSIVMKRFMARGRGRANRIEKPLAHLTVIVREMDEAELEKEKAKGKGKGKGKNTAKGKDAGKGAGKGKDAGKSAGKVKDANAKKDAGKGKSADKSADKSAGKDAKKQNETKQAGVKGASAKSASAGKSASGKKDEMKQKDKSAGKGKADKGADKGASAEKKKEETA